MLEMLVAERTGRPKGGENARRSGVTTFGHLLASCGLTHDEAAIYLERSIASVKAYALGTRHPPAEVLDALATLWEQVSFRQEPTVDLPPPAAARRKALQDVRLRTWHRKDHSPDEVQD